MRNSTSKRSLKKRGMAPVEIEKRIRMIEKWQAGYERISEKVLFGDDYPKYIDILKKMEVLCQEAESIAFKAKSTRNNI